MLKLFIYFKGKLLKARIARADETFTHPTIWKNKIQFEITSSPDFMMIWTSLIPDLPREEAMAFLSLVGARYPFSADYQELKQSNAQMVFNAPDEEWIFFGGTFNPWHQGHQACLDLIDHKKTCLLVPDRNPQKELLEIDPITTLLELSSKVHFRANQYFVPTFLLDHKTNPTIEWVEILKRTVPEKKISLLMGFDSLKSLPSWIRVNELLSKLHTLYVVSRLENEGEQEIAVQKVHNICSSVHVELLGHHLYENLSSTELRAKKKET